MSGAELIEILNGRPDRSHTRIIVSFGWDNLRSKAMSLGADDAIQKPFELEALIKLLKKVI